MPSPNVLIAIAVVYVAVWMALAIFGAIAYAGFWNTIIDSIPPGSGGTDAS